VKPHTSREIAATMVVKMQIEDVSAKVCTGGPIDDEADEETDICAGSLPIVRSFGVLERWRAIEGGC